MKQSCVRAFARAARVLALAAVLTGLGVGSLLAQGGTTGKIEGRVRDQAGAPIANAQVFIVGTAFNALTNPQGYYFINNVPAGTVTIRAAFVGYRPVEYSGVRVLAGQTLTQDFTLEQTAVELEAVEIVAEVPLVPRDEVTTKQRVDGEYTENLPVDQISNVLALQPGVVANAAGTALSIRGGRNDEAVTYVDGVPVTAGARGNNFVGVAGRTNVDQFGNPSTAAVAVATNAFEEASVTTGGQSAEFGNAQSGVISIQTKAGGTDYSGSVRYETDEPLGSNSLGFNRVEAAFSGPVPIGGVEGLTFHVSGALQGQQSAASGIGREDVPIFVSAGVDTTVAVPSALNDPTSDTTYVDVLKFAAFTGDCDDIESANPDIDNNYGQDCQGIRIPTTAASSSNLQGKVQYTYGTGSRLAFTYLRNQQNNRIFSHTNLYNPQQLEGFLAWSSYYTLSWTQNLSKSAERALALETYLSLQHDRAMRSPLTRETESDTRDPFGGFFFFTPSDFKFNFQNFAIDDDLIRNYRLNLAGSRRAPYDLENQDQYTLVDVYRNNAYGLEGFSETGGPDTRLSLYRENRIVGKANLDWQVDRYNRIKLGGEFTRYDILSYSHQLTSQAFSNVYHEKPIRFDLFVEDRLDLGDVVVQGGLRYDFYDTRASRPAAFPRISSHPDFDPANPDAFFANPDLWRRDESHDYLSPHVQVSFPVTDRTNFRLSYAHQVQTPDFDVLLNGINTDLSITNTNNVYGADLDFGKTITFEFGIRHAFSDDMVLDISAFNKDKLADAAGRLVRMFDPQTNREADIRMMTTADFGNTRGVDVRLDRRFGRFFNGVIAYTFQDAKNTGTDPFTYINFGSRVLNQLSGGNQPPPQSILPQGNSRPHTLSGQLALNFPDDFQEGTTVGAIFRNVGAFATFRYASGTPFTRCATDTGSEQVLSPGVCNGNIFASDPFGARLPSFKEFNLRLTKGFGIRGLDVTAYADIRNLFNFRNILQVFTVTNDVRNQQAELDQFEADSNRFLNEAVANGVYDNNTGAIDLTFGTGNSNNAACANWTLDDGTPAAPNCIYLVRAEERWGNGDHVFTLDEQRTASRAAFQSFRNLGAGYGAHSFLGQGRNVRFGLEVNF